MVERISRLFSQRQILKNMVIKELKAKYVGSILGISWAMVTPLLIMFAISFTFTKIMKVEIEKFPLFVLSAILPWIFFSTSLSEATPSIVNNLGLLRQFSIPKEFIPVSLVLANFINFIFGLFVIIPVFLFFKIRIAPYLVFLPAILLSHLIFTVGLSLFLSCVNIYFRDTSHLLGVGLLFWFWITPIFYSISMVPEGLRWICMMNPMTSYIEGYRNILFEAKIPSLYMISIAFIVALIALVIGYSIFIKYESYFIKRI